MDPKTQVQPVVEFKECSRRDKSVTSPASGYLGALVRFEDGSRWKMTGILSDVKYQQSHPPFEARQVLECVCVEDPHNQYRDAQVAVTKVKYQIHGSDESKFFYWNHVEKCRQDSKAKGTDDGTAREFYEHAKELLHIATQPVNWPHKHTVDEVAALDIFDKVELAHAPRLLGFAGESTAKGVDDDEAMHEGYTVFMLMNKLPGVTLNEDKFWNKDEETREEIRRAFKVALMDVWSYGVKPMDSGIHNIIWNEQEHTCYIVDFEDYTTTEQDPETLWTDDHYTGIPISIGANEAVHQQRLLDEEAEADERQEEFYLDVFCDAKSRKKNEVDGAIVVLDEGKIRLWPKDPETGLPTRGPNDEPPPYPFTGLYLPFPSSELPHRPMPAAPTLGLVSTVPPSTSPSPASSAPSTPSPTPPSRVSSQRTKPKLNWIYADNSSRELRYGPRAEAKKHKIGPWDWTEDEQGLTLDGEECLVAVEEEKGGYGWAVYWDREDDCLKEQGVGKEKRVLRCSLERRLVEEHTIKGLNED
ncbi:Vacuolar sorting-associated VPS28 [Pyrenophora seminiperda CCB06]|uniref:Vacuolar sorting-associated VPS28 n=1 Tax=Pyrenophora seminiperda CCB06 TaxID=1302712 RepID=A0A3M7LZ48_9PLEO|nr:Vacuolar sorting-associated VPS28 [Pyrenophora seminiperda CCB06]